MRDFFVVSPTSILTHSVRSPLTDKRLFRVEQSFTHDKQLITNRYEKTAERIFCVRRLLLYSIKFKLHYDGVVVGILKARYYVFNRFDANVVRRDKSVYYYRKVAFFIRNVAVTTRGV